MLQRRSPTIKIIPSQDYKLITSTVTDFSDALGYCEHKIPFYIEGIKAAPTVEKIHGSKAHQEEEEIEKEQFEFVPITQEELADMSKDVELAREGIFTRLLVPVNVDNENVALLLHGRSDKVMRVNETLVVQDDKFPTNLKKYEERFEPFPDQILQALTYLNSKFCDDNSMNPQDWFPIEHKEKMWIIQIRDKKNDNKPFKIFKGIQNKDARDFLVSAINRYVRLILEKEERIHHNNPAKCKPCGYFGQCQFRLG